AFHSEVFWRKASSGKDWREASISLIFATNGRSLFTSRSFLEPIIFFRIPNICLSSRTCRLLKNGRRNLREPAGSVKEFKDLRNHGQSRPGILTPPREADPQRYCRPKGGVSAIIRRAT